MIFDDGREAWNTAARSANGPRVRERPAMARIQDKIVGKTKQVIAEITGDGKLAEEGMEQVKKPDPKANNKPPGKAS
jgi:hypothetical protein